MIYFDNSASTIVKPKNVVHAVISALTEHAGNPGRSGHKISTRAGLEIEKVRSLVASHVGTTSENVIFTLNCTDALNLAILGSAHSGHLICSVNEHNSVLRPLEHLSKTFPDFSYSVASQTGKIGLVWADIERHFRPNTHMVVVNHISNVNGDVAAVEEIGLECQKRGLIFAVDGAQSGGHFRYDMKKMGINMLALAPHKGFYSPQGVGVLAINGDFPLNPIRFGGTGTNSLELTQPAFSPERFESGTLNSPAICGFGEGIKFVEENQTAIATKLEDLVTYLHYELAKLPLEIYTKAENTNGVFAFNVPNVPSDEVSNFLNEKFGICVRSGLHCAPLKHKSLGSVQQGAVRISLSYFNTYQEIERFVYAIKSFLKYKF